MGVRLILKDGTLTALLSGEIDHHSARTMREEIDRALEQAKPRRLVLDFLQIRFMDSSGVGLIMGRYKLMMSLGGIVILANMPPKIEKIISLAGMDRLTRVERNWNHEGNQ